MSIDDVTSAAVAILPVAIVAGVATHTLGAVTPKKKKKKKKKEISIW